MNRMGSLFAPSLSLGVLLLCSEIASAKSVCGLPWERLDEGARNLARPYSLILTGAAALPPIVLAPTGADYDLRRTSQLALGGSYSPEPISLLAPYVFYPASWIFFVGAAALGYCPGQTRSVAIIQATSETLLVVGLIKWTTGRTWPLAGRSPEHPEALEHPEDGNSWAPFRSGLGAFPSGHTAFFFAAAGALRAASPDLGILRYAGYPLGAAIGFAMWYGDHHWASDVLSGALLGEAIGAAAGRAWAPQGRDDEVSFLVLPTSAGVVGALSGTF